VKPSQCLALLSTPFLDSIVESGPPGSLDPGSSQNGLGLTRHRLISRTSPSLHLVLPYKHLLCLPWRCSFPCPVQLRGPRVPELEHPTASVASGAAWRLAAGDHHRAEARGERRTPDEVRHPLPASPSLSLHPCIQALCPYTAALGCWLMLGSCGPAIKFNLLNVGVCAGGHGGVGESAWWRRGTWTWVVDTAAAAGWRGGHGRRGVCAGAGAALRGDQRPGEAQDVARSSRCSRARTSSWYAPGLPSLVACTTQASAHRALVAWRPLLPQPGNFHYLALRGALHFVCQGARHHSGQAPSGNPLCVAFVGLPSAERGAGAAHDPDPSVGGRGVRPELRRRDGEPRAHTPRAPAAPPTCTAPPHPPWPRGAPARATCPHASPYGGHHVPRTAGLGYTSSGASSDGRPLGRPASAGGGVRTPTYGAGPGAGYSRRGTPAALQGP